VWGKLVIREILTVRTLSFEHACLHFHAGTYSGPHASICTKCGVGKFSTASGTVTGTVFKGLAPVQVVAADSQSVCTFCTAGFKANSLGASSCDACDVGTFAYAQSTVCSACPPGTSSNNTGARADNVTVCKTCGFGSWSGQAFRFCTLCLAGKYHNLTGVADAGFCKECLAGRYSAPGSSACLDCSTGTHSSAGAAVCLDCAAGTASKARGLAANSATVCSDCAPGNFSVSGSSLCLQCQRGLFSAGSRSGSCTACELGFHNPYVSATSCVECPINTYGNNTGLASCFPCPTDLFARSASIAIQDCRTAQIEVSPDDKDWGPIIESAPSFAMIFLRPGTYGRWIYIACCGVMQFVALCCRVLQCAACRRVECAGRWIYTVCCSVMQFVAVCCSVLQCVAVCCVQMRCMCRWMDIYVITHTWMYI